MQAEDERALNDAAILRSISAQFSATPDSIRPFEIATLRWQVTIPDFVGPRVSVTLLNGATTIGSGISGRKRVSPVGSRGFRLVAKRGSAQRTLGIQYVTVDTSQCEINTFLETDIAREVSLEVDRLIASNTDLSRRRPDSVTLEFDGLHISLRLKADIENVADPDINVDVRVSLYADDGELRYRLDRYAFEINFPWYQDFINIHVFPAWLAAALAEGSQSSFVKAELIRAFDQFIAGAKILADATGHKFSAVRVTSDGWEVTTCPAIDENVAPVPQLAPETGPLAPSSH